MVTSTQHKKVTTTTSWQLQHLQTHSDLKTSHESAAQMHEKQQRPATEPERMNVQIDTD